jgi:hypothetical protein
VRARRAIGVLGWLLAVAAGCATTSSAAGAAAGGDDGPSREKRGLQSFAPAGATARPAGGRRFGLFIGLSSFGASGFPALRYAAKDARDFAGAVEALDHSVVLSTPEETRRPAILAALADLSRRATRAGDTVMVYVSSHGALARRPGGPLQRYIITSDTVANLVADTALSVAELLAAVERMPARRRAVVLAFCHSGSGKSVMTDELAEALRGIKGPFVPPPLEEVSEATAVLSASDFGETAREDDRLSGDVYTHFLVEGAGKADADGDGAVTLTEAHDYARSRTYAFTGGTQRPSARLHLVGADPIVLRGVRTRRPRPVLFSYAPSAQGIAVSVDGRPKGQLPGSLVLDEGRHQVELRAGDAGAVLYRGALTVQSGDRVEVSELLPGQRRPLLAVRFGLLSGLSGPARSDLLPAAPSVGLEASLPLAALGPRRTGLQLALRLDVDFAHGDGSATGPVGISVPYRADLVQGSTWAVVAWQYRRFMAEAGVGGGALWLHRGFASSADDGVGLVVGGRLGGGLDLGRRLAVGLSIEPAALVISVGGQTRAVPLLRALATLSVRL